MARVHLQDAAHKPIIFFDASALAKGYLSEQGAANVRATMDRFAGYCFVTDFVALEVLTTFSKRFRASMIAKRVYRDARVLFLSEFSSAFHRLEVGESVRQSAFALADSYRHVSVSAMDILHVASALELQADLGRRPLVIVSSDQGFLALAHACGLRTFNPETQPFGTLLAIYGWRGAN